MGWQGSLVFFALLTGVLVYIFMRGKKEFTEETGEEAGPEVYPEVAFEEA